MTGSLSPRAVTPLAAAILVVLVAGCGSDMATSPTTMSTTEFTGQPIPLPADERFPQAGDLLAQELPSVTVLVSAAAGGRVTMGRYSLEFPPGALAQDTPITIRQADPAAMILELKPHGIQFSRPVILSARIGGLTAPGARSVGVAWMNPETGLWEVVGETGASASVASAGLWHFSDYNIWSD